MERDPMKSISAKALIEEGCSHHGFVVKEGGRLKSMQPRYFVLHKGCLYYFKDFQSSKEQGSICLAGYELKEDLQHDEVYGIKLKPIQPGKKTLYFVLSTNDERKIWIEKFNQEMQRIAGDGVEEYDYCYESRASPHPGGDEPIHTYEPTDEIDHMRPSANSHTKQPGPPLLYPKPTAPPPSIPARTTGAKPRSSSGCSNNNNEFMPPLPPSKPLRKPLVPPVGGNCPLTKRPAPQPPNTAFSPPGRERASNKEIPPLPNPLTKPVLSKNLSLLTQEEFMLKKAGMEELARKVQETRKMQKYEVQEIKPKPSVSSDSDSDSSDSYLDLSEQNNEIRRERPAGSSFKQNEKSKTNYRQFEAILPKSVFQTTLSRDTAESVLNGIKMDGMYLIRQGREGLQVLTVYTPDSVKHYKVFEDSGSLYLRMDEPRFFTLEELVNHYFKNALPTCDYKLQIPYS